MNKQKKILKFILTFIIVIILVLVFLWFKKLNGFSPEQIKLFISGYGKIAPFIYIIMFSLVPLTLFPDSILAIAGGLLFGLIEGFILTCIGALVGGSISFFISRYLGEKFISKIENHKINKIKDEIEKKGFFIVLILRLIPLFPFDLISYGAGLTKIKYKDFLLATFLGTIPGILVFTNIGAEWVNFGETKFYLSIMLLILLIVSSVLLKKKFLENGKI